MDTTPATTVHAAPVSTRQQRRPGVAPATAVIVAALLLMGLLPPLDAAAATPNGPPAGSVVGFGGGEGDLAALAAGVALVGLVVGLVVVRTLVRRERPASPEPNAEDADSPEADLDPEARLAEALAAGSGRRLQSAARSADLPLWVRRLDPDAGSDEPH